MMLAILNNKVILRVVLSLFGLTIHGLAATAHPDASDDPLPQGAMLRIGTTRFRHGDRVFGIAFSPDGKTLASAGGNLVWLWDKATGKEIRSFAGHRDQVMTVAFSSDGRLLASGSSDQTVRVWNADSGKEIHTLKGHKGRILSVAFVPDGQTVASGSEDNTIRLWDAGAGKELQILKGHSGWVQSVAFAPDGKTLASASWDNLARLWDVATGKVLHTLRGHPNGVYSVSFTPDGKTLATGSVDIRLWDVATGKALASRPGQNLGPYWSIAFSPDGKTLAWGGSDQMMHLWDVGMAKAIRTWKCHERRVLTLAFAPDGKTLAVASDCIRLWDTETSQEILPSSGHHAVVNTLAIAPDGKSLASGSDDKTVRLWRLDTGKEFRSWTERSTIESVAIAPDGKTLAAAQHWQIQLWDIATGRAIRSISVREAHPEALNWMAWAPASATLVSSGNDPSICLWDAVTGKQVPSFIGGTEAEAAPVFSADGQTLAVASDATVKLWSMASGKEIGSLRNLNKKHLVSSVGFAPDGKTVAAGTRGGAVWIWETTTGKQVHVLKGHQAAVTAVAFAPDGKSLVSTSTDATVRLWDVGTGKELHTLRGHKGHITSLAFAPDGGAFATGSGDTTVLVWRMIANRTINGPLTAQEVQACWTTLAGDDATQAYRSLYALAADPQQTVRFLHERLPKPDSELGKRLARLIADLDDDKYSVRLQASRELEQLGELATSALQAARNRQPSPEANRWLEQLLDKMTSPTAEQLQWLRAIQALELTGSAEAKPLLEALAKEAPTNRMRQDAVAVLRRLAK